MALRRRLRSKTTVAFGSPHRPPPRTPPPQAPAETAPRKPETRGRPKGTGSGFRVKNVYFDPGHGMNLLWDIAGNDNPSGTWNWDGKAYPKTRTQGPNQEGLANHAEVLSRLLTLAPNGYPCPYRLRDLLCKLHTVFKIFEHDDSALNLSSRAMLAADRWRIMCKHCLSLKLSGARIRFDNLNAVVRLIHVGYSVPERTLKAVLPKPAVVRFKRSDGERRTTSGPNIYWGQEKDDIPEAEIESTRECGVSELDLAKPHSSKLNPYFHHCDDTECAITAHRCACRIGQPASKQCRGSHAETAIPGAPAGEVDEAKDIARPEPTAMCPNIEAFHKYFVFPRNLSGELDTLRNSVPPPYTTTLEKRKSRRLKKEEGKGKGKGEGRKVPSLAATAATKKLEGKGKGEHIPVKHKHGGLESQKQPETHNTHHDKEDKIIGPPWRLLTDWKHMYNAQCCLRGMVGGKKNGYIVAVSPRMSLDFRTVGKQLRQEASDGKLTTKRQAIRRRDELIGKRKLAETANDLTEAAAHGYCVTDTYCADPRFAHIKNAD